MNSYLKEISDVCGINRPVTFHLARHTFATTVTPANVVPIETVSKLLGHKIGLGGSCHWCTEAIFQSLKGVLHVSQGWIASDDNLTRFFEAVVVEFGCHQLAVDRKSDNRKRADAEMGWGETGGPYIVDDPK